VGSSSSGIYKLWFWSEFDLVIDVPQEERDVKLLKFDPSVKTIEKRVFPKSIGSAPERLNGRTFGVDEQNVVERSKRLVFGKLDAHIKAERTWR
jgi:hypothetical protein